MRAIFLAAVVIARIVPAAADDQVTTPQSTQEPNLEAIFSDADCALLACRSASTASVVAKSDGTLQTLPVPRSPYVTKGGTIVIFPGESLVFDFPQDGGPPHFFSTIIAGKTINTQPLPTPVLAISLGPFHFVAGHEYMSLQMNGNFEQLMQYDITGTQIGANGGITPKGTETCVLMPGSTANIIPPGVPGPFLIGNIRPWANAHEFYSTHSMKLIGCKPADAIPS